MTRPSTNPFPENIPGTDPPCRVILLGGNGLLGGAFRRAWASRPGIDLREFTRAEINLTRPDQIAQALNDYDFDVLINAAAYTQVDDAEVQPELAQAVNSVAAGVIAECCATRQARMVHFSTDYVFDGGSSQPYKEPDTASPLSAYGRTKLEGERLVLAASSNHLVLRLAWLFGPGRDAFPEWVLREAIRHAEVKVVSDKTGSPTYSEDVPGWVEALLAAGASGLFHLVNGPPCTWFEYAQGVLETARTAGWPLRASQIIPVPLASLPGLTADRPVQSALDTTKFTHITGLAPRHWRAAMTAHLAGKAMALPQTPS